MTQSNVFLNVFIFVVIFFFPSPWTDCGGTRSYISSLDHARQSLAVSEFCMFCVFF